ncbi:MAG: sel1 repeat family protein [Candidatus Omnitrophica bacterium]|nr:sel1 repeat family protein [Candidatus Omnitrophota bacterium]
MGIKKGDVMCRVFYKGWVMFSILGALVCVYGPIVQAKISETGSQVGRSQSRDPISLASELLTVGGENNRSKAAKLLRSVTIEAEEEGLIYQAAMMLSDMKEDIRERYGEISDEELKYWNNSVGCALLDRYGYERAIDVLIEESGCLNSQAQIMLVVIYEYEIEGCPAYDKRILRFFEETAEEGLPRSQFMLGLIYQNGWGVEKDEIKGQKYLNLSDWKNREFKLPEEEWRFWIKPGANSNTTTA